MGDALEKRLADIGALVGKSLVKGGVSLIGLYSLKSAYEAYTQINSGFEKAQSVGLGASAFACALLYVLDTHKQ